MAINIKLLEKVKAHILEEPRRYDQTNYVQSSKVAPCGTAACILGWIDLLTSKKARTYAVRNGTWMPGVCERAQEKTGLTTQDINAIAPADAADWPQPFRRQFQRARTRKGRALAAANLIDHIIATGKVTD